MSYRAIRGTRDAAVMKPHYDDTITHPLTSDALIEERVTALVGRACRRQIWFLFVDRQNLQLPLIIPVSDPPSWPDATVSQLVDAIFRSVEDLDAQAVVVVLERYADATFTGADKAWARALETSFDATGLPMRAVLVSHRDGVRWLASDDYRFDGAGRAEIGG
ncbi:MAG: hypothetical protein V4531_01980 [Actinomycetota bacterium]